MHHFVKSSNSLHSKFQSAYRKFNSTETAMIKVVDDIQEGLYNQNCVVLLLLDSSAAFDTVDHSILIKMLRNEYALTENAADLIQSYLENRTFSVTVDDAESNIKTAKQAKENTREYC